MYQSPSFSVRWIMRSLSLHARRTVREKQTTSSVTCVCILQPCFLCHRISQSFRYLELWPSPVDLYQSVTVILPWISWIPDISNLGRVPGCELPSVYHCNFTLDILNPGYFELRPRPRVWTCVSVSLKFCPGYLEPRMFDITGFHRIKNFANQKV